LLQDETEGAGLQKTVIPVSILAYVSFVCCLEYP